MTDRVRPYMFYDVALTICSHCFRKLEGKIVFQEGNVYLLKRCPEHGAERVLVADDIDYYRRCREVFIKPPEMPIYVQHTGEMGLSVRLWIVHRSRAAFLFDIGRNYGLCATYDVPCAIRREAVRKGWNTGRCRSLKRCWMRWCATKANRTWCRYPEGSQRFIRNFLKSWRTWHKRGPFAI